MRPLLKFPVLLSATVISFFAVTATSSASDYAPTPPGAASNPGLELNDTACPTAGDCVSVGNYNNSSGAELGLIETQSGGSWTAKPAPQPSAVTSASGETLQSIDCTSVGNCVAVGYYSNQNNDLLGLIETESDGKWTATNAALPSDHASNPQAELASVSCTANGDCVAVGYYYASGESYYQPVIDTETNGRWNTTGTKPGSPSSTSTTPYASPQTVTCPAVGDCVLTGSYEATAGTSSSYEQIESKGKWGTATTAKLPAGVSSEDFGLFGLACPAVNHCVATGFYSTGFFEGHPLIDTETNGVWTTTAVTLPSGFASTDTAYLDAPSCSAVGHCVAGGVVQDNGDYMYMLASETDGHWTTTTAPLPSGVAADNGFYASVDTVSSCSASGECTVGALDTITSSGASGWLTERLHNGSWTAVQSALPSDFPTGNMGDVPWMGCSRDGYCAISIYLEGNASNLVSVLENSPAAVGALKTSVSSGTSVHVSWSPPSDDGGTAVTGYTITANDLTDAAHGGQTVTTAASATDATVSGLTAGDNYRLTVRAVNGLGNGIAVTSGAVNSPVNATRISRSLAPLAAPTGSPARIARLRRVHSYTFRYTALEAGRVTVDWYRITGTGKHARRVLVGFGSMRSDRSGRWTVKVTLTKAGRSLVAANQRLRLTATAAFTAVDGHTTSRASAFTLH